MQLHAKGLWFMEYEAWAAHSGSRQPVRSECKGTLEKTMWADHAAFCSACRAAHLALLKLVVSTNSPHTVLSAVHITISDKMTHYTAPTGQAVVIQLQIIKLILCSRIFQDNKS